MPDPDTLHGFYAHYMRAGLFTGFLTLTAFLFATVQFVVVNMKTHLYDTEAYRARIAVIRTEHPDRPIYAPLHWLSRYLMAALLCSLATSVLQFSLGLWPRDWAAGVCLAAAVATILLLFVAVRVILGNLAQMFADWEADGNNKLHKEQQATAAARFAGDGKKGRG